MEELLKIEEKELDILFKLGSMFKRSSDDFSTLLDRSLRYLDKIVLPIIMASKEDKSYNPFAEIIEKYVLHILIRKFEGEGYSLLPLGYSADLTLENHQHILNIDIKTANLDNPSDFRQTVNVGINQITHVAKLRLNCNVLPSPFFVYPNIPPFYEIDGKRKLILTYGLLFIYPPYRDLINDIREKYQCLFDFFNRKLKSVLVSIMENKFRIPQEKAKSIIESRPEKSRHSRDKLITESLIRGVFIHRQEKENILSSLEISREDREIIDEFSKQLEGFINQLRERDIKPIAIIAISLPNGLLKEKYLDKFVSGKDYARSARYHYEDGVFEVIKEKKGKEFPRVIFVDLKEKYLEDLKKHFKKIVVFDYHLQKVHDE